MKQRTYWLLGIAIAFFVALAIWRGSSRDVQDLRPRVQVQAFNNTGQVLFRCTAVYISGINTSIGLPEIDIADADASLKMPAAGLVADDIPVGSTGAVLISGYLADSRGGRRWAVGDDLYVSVNGASPDSECSNTLTNVIPPGAAMVQKVGIHKGDDGLLIVGFE